MRLDFVWLIAGAVVALLPETADGQDFSRPLAAAPGDPMRGREVVMRREAGNCLACHLVPGADPRQAGNLGPSLAGVGARFSAAELRLRVADAARLNPDTVMPPYHRTEGLNGVAPQYRGRPLLSAQQLEDAVAWLETLR